MIPVLQVMPYLEACADRFDALDDFQKGLIGGIINMISRGKAYDLTDKQVQTILSTYAHVILVPKIPKEAMAKIKAEAKARMEKQRDGRGDGTLPARDDSDKPPF